MRTKEQLKNIISSRIEVKSFSNATFSDLVSAVQTLSPAQRNLLVSMLVGGKAHKAGEILQKTLKTYIKQAADTEADTILANDSLSLAELDNII